MIVYLVMVLVTGVKADSFVQETYSGTPIQPNVTFRYIPTKEAAPFPESTDDYGHAMCPWTSTIDDNRHRIPRRIVVMDETHGLPATCNGNEFNMSGNFTCEPIRRKMKVLWIAKCFDEKCTLEERVITVLVGLTCVHNGNHDNKEQGRKKCRVGKKREKKCNKKLDNDCKGTRGRRNRCRRFCKGPGEGSKRCLNCKKIGMRTR